MKKKKKIKWKTLIPIYAMMLPGLIYLLINNYAPMFGLVIAFKRIDWGKGILKSDWVGFSNFSYLFSSDEAWTMTRNTIGYNILFIVIDHIEICKQDLSDPDPASLHDLLGCVRLPRKRTLKLRDRSYQPWNFKQAGN